MSKEEETRAELRFVTVVLFLFMMVTVIVINAKEERIQQLEKHIYKDE
jgi:hypothetical protein